MSLTDRFDAAAARAKGLPALPNETLLNIYALFKQAKLGDASGPQPGAFDLRGRAKFDAWSRLRGKSREDAMREYIALIESLG